MGPSTVPELLDERAGAEPEHTALAVDRGPTLTYGDWRRRATALAHGLVARGMHHGDRVALFFDNAHWTDYAACYVAVQKAGAAAVPLSPRFSAAELANVLDNAGATIVVCPPDLPAPTSRASLVHPNALETNDGGAALPLLAADDLAEIVYTSGTTGMPKGIAVTHRSIVVHDLPPDLGTPGSFIHAFPIGTNAGQECVRMPLRRVTTAVVLPVFDPERLCAAIEERRITRMQLVPSMAQLVVTSGAAERHDVSSVDRITLSSAPAPAELWSRLADAFPNATLQNAYALTEGGGARTLMRFDPSRPGSAGKPVGDTELRLVGDSGNDVEPGLTGEVWLRRRGAPRREYFRDPGATAEAFAGDWLRTGDIGYVDEAGYLYLLDRKKDLIISGGLNVSTLEVEQALAAHPAVIEAAAFGVPHPVLGQDVAAAVVLRDPIDIRELQSFVRNRLGEHKVPHRVFLLESLPRNDSGKVLKRELRERFASAAAAAHPQEPRSETEAKVAVIWCDVLGIERVGIHDDFFELGGQSLAAMQVAARLDDAFGVDLPATAVFEQPTVAELAAVVEQAGHGTHVR